MVKSIVLSVALAWSIPAAAGLAESEAAAKAVLAEYRDCGLAAVTKFDSPELTLGEVADVAVASCDAKYGELRAAIAKFLTDATNGNARLMERVPPEADAHAERFKSSLRSRCLVAAAEARKLRSSP